MAKAKQIYVRESILELKKLLGKRSVTVSNRLRMLILIKNNEGENLSKQKLGSLLGVSSKSLEEISCFIEDAAEGINKEIVTATCAYKYIFFDPFWNEI